MWFENLVCSFVALNVVLFAASVVLTTPLFAASVVSKMLCLQFEALLFAVRYI